MAQRGSAGGVSRRHVLQTIGMVGAGSLATAAAVNALMPLVLREELVFEPNFGYWARALPAPNAALRDDLEADVVVIGGGFTGLSAAYYLTRTLPGKRIALLEGRSCGNGASGRNGAMVLNLKRSSADPGVDRRLYDLTVDNIHRLFGLCSSLGWDCELEQNGALTVLNTIDDVRAARTELAAAQRAGIPIEYWDKTRTAATIGSSAYEGALFDPAAGQVHPGKLVGMWKAAAESAGVSIYEQTPVVEIKEGAVNSLATQNGHMVRAPIVVLATNAYTSKLGYLSSAIAPIFNYVCITPPIDAADWNSVGWTTRIPFNDSRREVYYAGATRDRRIHFGGGPVDYCFNDGLRIPRDARRRYAELQREFATLFPALAHIAFETTWSGLVDVSLDQNPAIGQIGRHLNIFYAIGYSGEGVNLTSVFGRVIADLAAGRREQWTWLPFLDRLPPYIPNEPFRWLAIEADLEYSRVTGG